MIGGRYYYYLFLTNGLINIIAYVPRILIEHTFDGALSSIFLSLLISMGLIALQAKVLQNYPNAGFVEILSGTMPPLLIKLFLIQMVFLWVMAGSITLMSFVDITKQYISPEMPGPVVLLSFLIVVCWVCRFDAASILYGLESLLLIHLPFVLFFMWKTLGSPYFLKDAVIQAWTYLWHAPNFEAVSAATFIFSGYVNMVVFNRVFTNFRFKMRTLLLILLTGFSILMFTFLVPIGYQGVHGAQRHVFVWFSTADMLRIDLFLIERLLFLFFLIYISLSLISAIVHWHVGLDLLRSILPSPKTAKGEKWIGFIAVIAFALATAVFLPLNQDTIISYGRVYLNMRLIGEVGTLLLLLYAHRRRRRA